MMNKNDEENGLQSQIEMSLISLMKLNLFLNMITQTEIIGKMQWSFNHEIDSQTKKACIAKFMSQILDFFKNQVLQIFIDKVIALFQDNILIQLQNHQN
ncbi:unnamed protein product [Paramecium primaurelia]|uniref:Uncharacterized protein n=1 Tax=Paramecium primaurelia TaxID=5886 RepID=A0A8S1QHS4_PARPR|nr:unnamed protein product [Paramecium primaurelia]